MMLRIEVKIQVFKPTLLTFLNPEGINCVRIYTCTQTRTHSHSHARTLARTHARSHARPPTLTRMQHVVADADRPITYVDTHTITLTYTHIRHTHNYANTRACAHLHTHTHTHTHTHSNTAPEHVQSLLNCVVPGSDLHIRVRPVCVCARVCVCVYM